MTPIKCYDDALSNKNVILLENKNKSGVYRWINKYNNNTYVGSGLNLSKRIGEYFRLSELQKNKRPINSALLKYGHDNFILEILEYCEIEDLIKREQYYLDLLIRSASAMNIIY
jgi:group I intron endonuclease